MGELTHDVRSGEAGVGHREPRLGSVLVLVASHRVASVGADIRVRVRVRVRVRAVYSSKPPLVLTAHEANTG